MYVRDFLAGRRKTQKMSGVASRCAPKLSLPPVKKAVVVSTSRNIFRNLALEHWFYKNSKFDQNHMLMLWVNEPCVVIGRHQNPWSECNVPWLMENETPLARRNSGGGTVYHDAGNLNLTFFTPNSHYHRRSNLEFVADAVYKEHGLRMDINKREDLAVRDHKVSGTAAKLARHCAYHHCTLLINADTDRLRSALLPTDWHIASNATKSTKSKILNLHEECADITVDGLLMSLARSYLEWNNANRDSGNNHRRQIESEHVAVVSMDSIKAQFVTATEAHFPGIDAIHDEYKSWEWTFGKTPRFVASKMFKIRERGGNSGRTKQQQPTEKGLTCGRANAFVLSMQVENGLIAEVDVSAPGGYSNGEILQRMQKAQATVGEKYDVGLMRRIERVFEDASDIDVHVDSVIAN